MVTIPMAYITEPLWFYILLGAFSMFLLLEAAKLGYRLFEMARALLLFLGL